MRMNESTAIKTNNVQFNLGRAYACVNHEILYCRNVPHMFFFPRHYLMRFYSIRTTLTVVNNSEIFERVLKIHIKIKSRNYFAYVRNLRNYIISRTLLPYCESYE